MLLMDFLPFPGETPCLGPAPVPLSVPAQPEPIPSRGLRSNTHAARTAANVRPRPTTGSVPAAISWTADTSRFCSALRRECLPPTTWRRPQWTNGSQGIRCWTGCGRPASPATRDSSGPMGHRAAQGVYKVALGSIRISIGVGVRAKQDFPGRNGDDFQVKGD